jgi:hypothetical protein
MRKAFTTGLLALSGLLFASGAASAQDLLGAKPSIDDTTVNTVTNQATISGSGFLGLLNLGRPSVTLADTALTIVGTPTATKVVVELPAGLAAGSYVLTMKTSPVNLTDQMDLAIGAIGPAGPIGPVGPQGPIGPMGPMGLTGAQGATGPQGATGGQGPAGANGAPGATGPQGAQGPQGDQGNAGPQGPQGISLPFAGTTTVNNDAAFSVTNAVFPFGIGIKGVATSGTGGYFQGGNSNVTGYNGIEAHGGSWGSSGNIAGFGGAFYGGGGPSGVGNNAGAGLVSLGGTANNGAGDGAVFVGGEIDCGFSCQPGTTIVGGHGVGNTGDGVVAFGGSLGNGLVGVGGTYGNGLVAAAGGTGTFAAVLYGDVQVNGTLSKSAGSFKIDDPLDPENKFLSHSFVESPDMMNIYNGLVTLDAHGEAWVTMPDYFEALNQDFRYQLTCVGGFAQVYVGKKVEGNRFQIAGGAPGLEVSWQVTGVRHDAYAVAHRIPVEEAKPEGERGHYLNPEAFGQTREQGIMHKPSSVNTDRQQQ